MRLNDKEYNLRWALYEAAAQYVELFPDGNPPIERKHFYNHAELLMDEHESFFEHLSSDTKEIFEKARAEYGNNKETTHA